MRAGDIWQHKQHRRLDVAVSKKSVTGLKTVERTRSMAKSTRSFSFISPDVMQTYTSELYIQMPNLLQECFILGARKLIIEK